VYVWRISEFADLTGIGGKKAAARWHSKGRPIVYMADNPASALLEVLVHTPSVDLPSSYQILKINVEGMQCIEPALPSFWIKDLLITREIGDVWLKNDRSPILKVPSAILPDCWHYLLNPIHSEARRAKIVSCKRFKLDPRLR
jgi:RES domain-containing protein